MELFESNTLIRDDIRKLAFELESHYLNEFDFKNHCYLRIAYDNVLNNKCDMVVKKPFVNNATQKQLEEGLNLLKQYLANRDLLKQHNNCSLNFRKNSTLSSKIII